MNLAKQCQYSNKVNQKSKAILYTDNEISETEIRKKLPFDIATTTTKKPRNKPNQGGKRPILRKLHNTEERKLQGNITDEFRRQNAQQNIGKPHPAIH